MSQNSNTEAAQPVALRRLVRHFIVLWDDEQGVYCPMGWDEDCAGAICCLNKSVAIFQSRSAATRGAERNPIST